MPKKPKLTPPPKFDAGTPDYMKKLEERDAERAAQREKERALILAGGAAFTAAMEEQKKLAFAERIAALSAAAKDLAGLGNFPALDDVKQQLFRELTVMGRELHNSRLA